ncbi:MAG: 4-alpha-glucanotransferase [bacterium]
MISPVSSNRQDPCFGRALSTKELKNFGEIYAQSQKALNKSLGIEKDSKVFIMPDFSMPDIDQENTGMGRLFSDGTQKFAKFIKNYFQADAMQVLPQNRTFRPTSDNFFCPYSCHGYSMGEHTINLKALTKKEYGEILTKQEFDDFVNKNQTKERVNAENELGIKHQRNPILELLKITFERFQKNDTPELNKLHQEFNAYKNDPIEAERMERISLYDVLNKEHPTLFSENFDVTKRKIIIADAQKNHADEIEFFKFWQFLADNHHQKSREILKKEGVELFGDCPFAFSSIDKWTNPEAYQEKGILGFEILNFDRTFKKDGTLDIAGEELKKKMNFFFKRYDGIRFDMGIRYAQDGTGEILKLIEKTAKEVKGADFDLNKLSYEEGSGYLFNNKVVIKQKFWLSPNQKELEQVGLGNHDNWESACAITEAKKISQNNFQEIVKEKFGKLLTYPKKFIFFDDFFGKERVFNYENAHPPKPESFRAKLSPNYEEEYHTALQKGDGFNLMESLAIAMKLQGLDKTEPKLYEEVVKQGKILRDPGAKTQEEADKIQKKKLIPKIAIGVAAAAVIITSAILIKNKKSQPQNIPQSNSQDEYTINPQYQYLRVIQNQRKPLI